MIIIIKIIIYNVYKCSKYIAAMTVTLAEEFATAVVAASAVAVTAHRPQFQ